MFFSFGKLIFPSHTVPLTVISSCLFAVFFPFQIRPHISLAFDQNVISLGARDPPPPKPLPAAAPAGHLRPVPRAGRRRLPLCQGVRPSPPPTTRHPLRDAPPPGPGRVKAVGQCPSWRGIWGGERLSLPPPPSLPQGKLTPLHGPNGRVGAVNFCPPVSESSVRILIGGPMSRISHHGPANVPLPLSKGGGFTSHYSTPLVSLVSGE